MIPQLYNNLVCNCQRVQERKTLYTPYMTFFNISLYGCFLKWWYPQNTPKWSFLVGKPLVVGETHHFRKPPYHYILSYIWILCQATELDPTAVPGKQVASVRGPPHRLREGAKGKLLKMSPKNWEQIWKTAECGGIHMNLHKMIRLLHPSEYRECYNVIVGIISLGTHLWHSSCHFCNAADEH